MEKKAPQRNNWFIATLTLIVVLLLSGVTYFAYYLGQNSNTNQNKDLSSIKTDFIEKKPTPAFIPPPVQSNTPMPNLPMPPNNPGLVENPNKIVNGQIFVVTKGRENVKLALVRVCAVSDVFIQNWIQNKKMSAVGKEAQAQIRINQVEQQLKSIEAQIRNAPIDEYGYSSAKSSLEIKRIEIESDLQLAQLKKRYFKTPEYYFEGLFTCDYSAKTDADGKYQLTIPSGRKFAIFATTSRKVFKSEETYWWMVWSNPNNQQEQIDFTNDNLMSENPTNAVVQIY